MHQVNRNHVYMITMRQLGADVIHVGTPKHMDNVCENRDSWKYPDCYQLQIPYNGRGICRKQCPNRLPPSHSVPSAALIVHARKPLDSWSTCVYLTHVNHACAVTQDKSYQISVSNTIGTLYKWLISQICGTSVDYTFLIRNIGNINRDIHISMTTHVDESQTTCEDIHLIWRCDQHFLLKSSSM